MLDDDDTEPVDLPPPTPVKSGDTPPASNVSSLYLRPLGELLPASLSSSSDQAMKSVDPTKVSFSTTTKSPLKEVAQPDQAVPLKTLLPSAFVADPKPADIGRILDPTTNEKQVPPPPPSKPLKSTELLSSSPFASLPSNSWDTCPLPSPLCDTNVPFDCEPGVNPADSRQSVTSSAVISPPPNQLLVGSAAVEDRVDKSPLLISPQPPSQHNMTLPLPSPDSIVDEPSRDFAGVGDQQEAGPHENTDSVTIPGYIFIFCRYCIIRRTEIDKQNWYLLRETILIPLEPL